MKKINIILISLLFATFIISSGYGLWSQDLIIEGDITVVPDPKIIAGLEAEIEQKYQEIGLLIEEQKIQEELKLLAEQKKLEEQKLLEQQKLLEEQKKFEEQNQNNDENYQNENLVDSTDTDAIIPPEVNNNENKDNEENNEKESKPNLPSNDKQENNQEGNDSDSPVEDNSNDSIDEIEDDIGVVEDTKVEENSETEVESNE